MNREVQFHILKGSRVIPIMIPNNSIPCNNTYLININSNIVLPSTARPSESILSCSLPTTILKTLLPYSILAMSVDRCIFEDLIAQNNTNYEVGKHFPIPIPIPTGPKYSLLDPFQMLLACSSPIVYETNLYNRISKLSI